MGPTVVKTIDGQIEEEIDWCASEHGLAPAVIAGDNRGLSGTNAGREQGDDGGEPGREMPVGLEELFRANGDARCLEDGSKTLHAIVPLECECESLGEADKGWLVGFLQDLEAEQMLHAKEDVVKARTSGNQFGVEVIASCRDKGGRPVGGESRRVGGKGVTTDGSELIEDPVGQQDEWQNRRRTVDEPDIGGARGAAVEEILFVGVGTCKKPLDELWGGEESAKEGMGHHRTARGGVIEAQTKEKHALCGCAVLVFCVGDVRDEERRRQAEVPFFGACGLESVEPI